MKPTSVKVYAEQSLVGALSIDQYHEIKRDVRRDWRPYLRQAANLLTVVMVMLGRTLMLMPVNWFWLMAAAALYDPSFLGQLRRGLLTGDVVSFISSFQSSLELATLITALGLGAYTAFKGRVPGASNAFQDQACDRIRQMLNVPDGASMMVVEEFSAAKR